MFIYVSSEYAREEESRIAQIHALHEYKSILMSLQ